MNGLEIFLIIFVVIIIIVSLFVAIYFINKNNNKQEKPIPLVPSSQNGTSPSSQPQNGTSPSNKPNGTDNVNGFSAYSVGNFGPTGPTQNIWTVYSGLIDYDLKLGPTLSSENCGNFLFKLAPPIQNSSGYSLQWQGNPSYYLCVIKAGIKKVELKIPEKEDIVRLSNKEFYDFDWNYDNILKIWYLVREPDHCMNPIDSYIFVSRLPSNFNTLSATDPNKTKFQWNNTSLPYSTALCAT